MSISIQDDSVLTSKVVLLGATGCGKTSLGTRYTEDIYNENPSSTVGANFFTKSVSLSNGNKIQWQVWDTAGQEKFRSLVPMYYKGAMAAIVVYDSNNADSFEDMKQWILELKQQFDEDDEIIIVLCENKCDLERVVDVEQRDAFASELGAPVFTTSAKTGQGVSDVFEYLGTAVSKAQKFDTGEPEEQSEILPNLVLEVSPEHKKNKSCCHKT